MKCDSDSRAQFDVLLNTVGVLLPILFFLLLFAVDFPVENWRTIVAFGPVGLLGGAAVALFATREARRRGVEIDPVPGHGPNRWTPRRFRNTPIPKLGTARRP